ncbi:MAG: hypothetical protein PWP65_1263 [Clostridia bacterium]|nr:hypothetical protein [Clostridia bacterium]
MGAVGEIIAKYVSSLDLASIPAEVIEKTKMCLLDTLSVAVAGSQSKEARIVQSVVSRLGGAPEATVINSETRLPAPNAALINATMAHSLELDDTDRYTYYHPGAPIIMAALAVAEARGCSGKRLLEGILAGYEVSIRIAEAVNPAHRWRGFHTTGTVGTFGAGIACAKILGLEPPKIVSTLGISGTQAAGLFEFLQDGSMTKRFHPGKSAWNGIMAAYLAEAGFTGPATILEGENGFLRATSDGADISRLADGLGEAFRIMRVGIKRHAACRYCHTSIDAALEIKDTYNPYIKDIEKIEVYVSKLCARQTGKADASTLLAAQLSTPYSVALALAKGEAGIDAFLSGLSDPEVISLMQKVEVREHGEFGETGRQALVRVRTRGRGCLEKRVDLAKGEPENPLTPMEFKEKIRGLCSSILGEEKTGALLSFISGIEREESLGRLFSLLKN